MQSCNGISIQGIDKHLADLRVGSAIGDVALRLID